jgi:cytochrome c556
MKMNLAVSAAALLLGATLTLDAVAQVKPEVLVKQRKAAMTLQGKYFGPIGAMVQGKAPYDAQIVARNAAYLEVLTAMPWDGFQPATENEKDTRAKPDLFKDKAKFDQYAKEMQGTVAKLNAAAKAADQGAVKAAFGDTAKACKTCHDAYWKE